MIASCIAIAALLLTGCSPIAKKTTTTTTTANTTASQALQDRIAAAESRIAGLESGANSTKTDVDSLVDRVTILEGNTGEATNYDSEIADLQDQIDALTDEIDALSTSNSETPTAPASSEIRWRFEQPAFYDSRGNLLTNFTGYLRADARIKDEDIYYIDLTITTDPAIVARTSFYVELTLKPSSSSDYALLSEDTYLDTDDTVTTDGVTPTRIPEPSWDSDFQTKTREGLDTTKKVVFGSDIITVTSMGLDPDYIYIPLVLELYYAD